MTRFKARNLWEVSKTTTNFTVVSSTTDSDTRFALLNCIYILTLGTRKKKNKLYTQAELGLRSRNMTKETSRVLPYVSSVGLSEWDLETLKPRCIPLVSGYICAGHLVSVCDSSRSKSRQISRERFRLARVVDERGKRLEAKEWKRSRKEIGAWWWLRTRGKGEVDEISIYTTPHS